MSDDNHIPHCNHCGEHIRWTETIGWIHGELGGGWNTACFNGEGSTIAEVCDEWLNWLRNT